MKTTRSLAVVCAVLMAACLSSGAFTLRDSEGFAYTTQGQYSYSSVYFFPITVTGTSGDVGDGLLFYNPTLNAVTLVVFESDAAYGWTLQGRWTGEGCTFAGANNNGRLYTARMYIAAGLAALNTIDAEAGSNYR